jgi:hypothetical protein
MNVIISTNKTCKLSIYIYIYNTQCFRQKMRCLKALREKKKHVLVSVLERNSEQLEHWGINVDSEYIDEEMVIKQKLEDNVKAVSKSFEYVQHWA